MKYLLTSLVLIALYSFTLPTGFVIDSTPAPKQLQDLANKEKVNLQTAVKFWIAGAMNEDYSDWGKDAQVQVLVAYGLFNLGNYQSREIRESGNRDIQKCMDNGGTDCFNTAWLKSFKEKIAYPIYKSKSLQDLAYKWLKPIWKEAIDQMDQNRRDSYMAMINHAIYYCNTFDYDSEKAFLVQCEKGDNKSHFTSCYPINKDGTVNFDGNPNNYRKLEAWIFRRVNDNHMSITEIKDWLKKIKSELF